MPAIVLTTLNARYAHASFGLRYLRANLGALRDQCAILEFDISQRPVDVVAELLAQDPAIVGLGIYIWNARESLEVIRILKQVRPAIRVVIGGPEVSHEWESQEIVRCADHLITGEADLEFARLCRELLAAGAPPPGEDNSRTAARAWNPPVAV